MKSQPILRVLDEKGQSRFQLHKLSIVLTFSAIEASFLTSDEVIRDTKQIIFVLCLLKI